jgi:hypothetical protein
MPLQRNVIEVVSLFAIVNEGQATGEQVSTLDQADTPGYT